VNVPWLQRLESQESHGDNHQEVGQSEAKAARRGNVTAAAYQQVELNGQSGKEDEGQNPSRREGLPDSERPFCRG
jgi:hypothetical protein